VQIKKYIHYHHKDIIWFCLSCILRDQSSPWILSCNSRPTTYDLGQGHALVTGGYRRDRSSTLGMIDIRPYTFRTIHFILLKLLNHNIFYIFFTAKIKISVKNIAYIYYSKIKYLTETSRRDRLCGI
jgi:hypothetical protein